MTEYFITDDTSKPVKKENTRREVQELLRYIRNCIKEVSDSIPKIRDWEDCDEIDISYLTIVIRGVAKDLEKAYDVTSEYHRLNSPISNYDDEYEDEEPGDWYEGDESFYSIFGEDNYD